MKRMKRDILILMGGVALFGCGGPAKEMKVEYPPAYHYQPGGDIRTEGSLWTESQSLSLFFADTKAKHVGDTVTVRIVENAKGTKDAKTKTGRSSKLDVKTGTGFTKKVFDGFSGETSNESDGSGSTSRSGALTADLTAVVVSVFPNGNMVIEGRREVVINNEKEFISVSGVIRPSDIGAKNTVLSSVISDAKIEYTGLGNLSDKQGPGWFVRIFDWVWPF